MPRKKVNHLVVKEDSCGLRITGQVWQRTLSSLLELWKSRELCDITIMVNSKELVAHRLVLAVNSDYFRAMFCAGFQESNSANINIDNVTYEALKSLLEFMYTGNLLVTKTNVQEILVCADILQMQDIKQICSEFMEREIDASNCLGILEFAESYACKDLSAKCVQLIKLRFPVVAKTEEFLLLRTAALAKILQYEDLCLGFGGEAVVFDAIIAWMEHDPISRIPDLSGILKYVRLQCIPWDVLQAFCDTTVVKENPDVKSVIEDILNSTGGSQNGRKAVRFIYTIGGYLQSRTGPLCPRLKTVERYDIRENKWENMENIPILASGVQAFNIFGRLFCLTFEMSSQSASDNEQTGLLEYDTLQNKWINATESFSVDAVSVLCDCLKKLGAIALCTQTNKVYSIAKASVNCIHTELEDGDLACRRVESLPEIEFFKLASDCRSNFSAVVCQGSLYVIGGDERYSQLEIFPTAATLKFDSDESKWIPVASMNEPRARFDAVELNGYIYAVGGFYNKRLRSVERYDPRSNKWSYVAPMNKERSHLKAVVLDEKIFVMGGKSYSFCLGGARKVLNSCEVYDPSCDTWTYTQPMKQARCMFGAVVM